MSLHVVITGLISILSLISIFLGALVAQRFSGKLRFSVIFLILAALVILIVKGIGSITSLAILNNETAKNIGDIGVILFIFLAMLTFKLTIDKID